MGLGLLHAANRRNCHLRAQPMRLIAATCAVVFMLWSLLAAFDSHRLLAIGMGIAVGLSAVAFISLTFHEELGRNAEWLSKGDDDVDLR